MEPVHQERLAYFKQLRAKKIDFPGYRDSPYGRFVHYCEDHVETLTHVNQYLRYCETFARISPRLDKSMVIGEAGGFSLISSFLASEGYDCRRLEGDFSYSIEADDELFDLVLSLETLEHIKDQQSDEMLKKVHFKFSGMRCYMSEISRILKPRGLLCLTTPNSNSLLVLHRWLRFEPAFMSPVHVRELTRAEVLGMTDSHFSELEYTTFYCFGLHNQIERQRILRAIRTLGAEEANRGDDHFFLFRKK